MGDLKLDGRIQGLLRVGLRNTGCEFNRDRNRVQYGFHVGQANIPSGSNKDREIAWLSARS
jgi:hypothetical protein